MKWKMECLLFQLHFLIYKYSCPVIQYLKAIRLQYFHHKIKLNVRKKPVPNFQDTKFVSHKQEWKWRNDAMTIKKKRTKIILPSILTVSLTCGLLLAGCQKTPDQSAVVSKAGGLSDDVIADPLKDGETQTLNLPEHWDTTVTWSNDRGVFHADQKLESVTTGNLPVIEVSQKKLELEQLNGLISYFAGGEILYQTQELTREYYQNLLDKIKNREGFYADNSVEYDLTGLEKLVEEVLPLAPEQTPLQEIGQIEYTSKKTDPAYEAKRKSLEAYGYDILPDTTKQDGMEIHFQATVGADAKGTINAETYDPEAGNYSIFSWSEGNGIELATIENTLARENLTAQHGVPAGSVKESFMEKLQALKDQMEETSLLEETAEDEAEKVLKDLNLENMQLLSSDKILWYAQSVMLSSLLLLLLFADMPFVNQMTPYWLIRTKRSVWMASQILYVILATCLYTVFLCLTELLIASPWAYVGNVWSETAASIGYGSNNHLTVPVSIKTMEMTTPYKCAICVVFLMLFYSLFITSVMLVLNLQKGRAGGVVGALLINLYGILLTPDIFQKVFHLGGGLSYRANILCGWLSPLNHATFPMHNFGYDYLPQIKISILLFLAVICILLFISRKCIKRYNFTFSQVDES